MTIETDLQHVAELADLGPDLAGAFAQRASIAIGSGEHAESLGFGLLVGIADCRSGMDVSRGRLLFGNDAGNISTDVTVSGSSNSIKPASTLRLIAIGGISSSQLSQVHPS